MTSAPLSRGANGWLALAALTAATDGAVRNGSTHPAGVAFPVRRDSDGLNLDDVEHVRQDRLRRWQKPADPTRKAAQP